MFSVIAAPPTFPDVQVGAAYPPTGKAFVRMESFQVRICWERERVWRPGRGQGPAPVPAGWTTRDAEAG